MKRYERFADDIAELIRSGVLGPGQRVPSVRYASQTHGVSPSTVFQAYYLLESRGLIEARPRSGYYVCRPVQGQAQPALQSSPALAPDGSLPCSFADSAYLGCYLPATMKFQALSPDARC